MSVGRTRILLTVLVPAAFVACTSGANTGDSPGAAQTVAVQVVPSDTRLKPGEQLQFKASVTGTANTAVDWQVLTPGGGSIDATGMYTAPLTEGSYDIQATLQSPSMAAGAFLQGASQANANGKGKARVTVQSVAVSVSPKTATVPAGGAITFTAAVTGSTNTAATWGMQEASGCGSVSSSGVYTAPLAAATCHVVATSNADPTKSDTATVAVSAPAPTVSVTVTPATGAVNSCQTLTFTATVTGTTNTAVIWSIQEGAAGGTITSGGVYTAPSSAGTYHVVATSAAAASSSALAPVAVTDKILSVAVSPQQASVAPNGTMQLAATVTTTCGTFPAN